MHELSLCMDIIDQVTALASEHRARAVSAITVKIGVLSGVEPSLLHSAFTVAQAGTVAERARFTTESVPARIRCTDCRMESEVPPDRLCCTACGSSATRLTAGDELTLASVELVVDVEGMPSPPEPGVSIH